MDVDIETVHDVSGTTRFEKALAILLGVGAVLAALASVVQLDASKREERALLRSSRLGVQVFEFTATYSPVLAYAGTGVQLSSGVSVAALTRQIQALQDTGLGEAAEAIGTADERAGARIQTVALGTTILPDRVAQLDPHLREIFEVVSADVAAFAQQMADPDAQVEYRLAAAGNELTDELDRELDAADRASDTATRALLSLALLALAGVLIGLAAVLRQGTAGWVALGSSGASVAVAAGLLVSTLVA